MCCRVLVIEIEDEMLARGAQPRNVLFVGDGSKGSNNPAKRRRRSRMPHERFCRNDALCYRAHRPTSIAADRGTFSVHRR